MQKLFIIAQKVDEHDDLLGFFVGWIREFEKYFSVETAALWDAKKSPKIIRWLRLIWHIVVGVPRSDVVFTHMSPMFAVLAGPWAWLWGKPVYLWYLHRSTTWKLRIAEKFCKHIFTASAESLTLKSDKIIPLGHGIDVARFATKRNGEFLGRILSVGRISPIKHFETLLETGLSVTIVGRPVMPGDFSYFESLKKFTNATFVGFVPYSDMPKYYANADIVVNMAPAGGLDKVVLEGMAAGCIPLTSNEAFRSVFGKYGELFIVPFNNPEALTERIKRITKLPPDEQEFLRSFVADAVQSFDLSVAIAKISRILAG